MAAVLKSFVRKISFGNSDSLQLKHKTSIQSNTSNTGLDKKKRKPGKEPDKIPVHHRISNYNNSAEYISDIENHIISKLLDADKKGITVDHIEHVDIPDTKANEEKDVKQENISTKLDKERIDRMVNFDYRYLKSKERTRMYHPLIGLGFR